MVKNMTDSKKDTIRRVADLMCTAALTAPKGSGKDTIRTAVIDGEDKDRLRDKMIAMSESFGLPNYARDAGNVDNSDVVVLIACTKGVFGFSHCGACGMGDCRTLRNSGAKCVFRISDLGIAVGSAVSIAADNRIDNRVMFTAGLAASKLGFLPDDADVCYAVPLSAGPKSIYFDRGPGAVISVSPNEDK